MISFLLVIARMSIVVGALEVSRAKLAHDATHDPLTGLCNRTLFVDRLDAVLHRGMSGALLFVDLDRFKQVNDRFGHEAGDQILAMVADRLRGALREGDIVSRLAGDEFAVMLPEVSETTAYFVAERLLHQLRFDVPFGGDDAGRLSASIGLVMWNRGDRTRTAAQLINEADRAMYLAKAGSGDQLATTRALSAR